MWFDGWMSLLRILVLGALGYVALILLLRASGKRSLSKMNAFDLVITISLGSVYATLLLSESVTLSEGVAALVVLVGLQWVVSSIYVRSRRFERLIKGDPRLLYWKGQFLDDALLDERVTREEVLAAMRASNVTSHKQAAAILETDGSLTVINTADSDDVPEAMSSVAAPELERAGNKSEGRQAASPTSGD